MATNVETLTNPRDNLPNVYNDITAREVDFVTRFNDNWDALRNILGIMRPIRKAPGTTLSAYNADIELEDGNVGAGHVIPYSKATITKVAKSEEIKIEKEAVLGDGFEGGNISDLGGYYNELVYFTNCAKNALPIEKATLSEGVKSLGFVLEEIKNGENAKGARRNRKGKA